MNESPRTSASQELGSSSDALVDRFMRRLIDDLVENNVLRGAWVEEIVSSFLPGWTFPGAWSYFDLLDPMGQRTLSVKHATGSKPRFIVARKKWAWDNRIAGRDGYEGWRGDEGCSPQHWCDVYVFAWLEGALERTLVMDVGAWKFAVLSRNSMYEHFDDRCKTATVGRIREIAGEGVAGSDLQGAVDAALTEPSRPNVPPLDLRTPEDVRPAVVAAESVQQALELPD